MNIAVNTSASAVGFSPHISLHAAPMDGLDFTLQFQLQSNMNFDVIMLIVPTTFRSVVYARTRKPEFETYLDCFMKW